MTVTWKARPLREVLRLSWPIAMSTISFSSMTLVDTALLGRVGRPELAGVALGGLVCFALLCFPMGLLRAGKVLAAQAIGAGRPQDVRSVEGCALLMSIVLGGVTVVLGQSAVHLVPHLSATAGAGEAAAKYIAIRIAAAPLFLAFVALRETSYGRGDSRSPMVATIVANVLNIVLASWLVLGWGKGVTGAAVATVLAHGMELAVLIWLRWRRKREPTRPAPSAVSLAGAFWRLGWPTGLQLLLEMGAFSILSLLVSLFSEAEMAGHQIAIQVSQFLLLPIWAVGEAAAVMVGQAVGANEDALITKVARTAASVTLVCAALNASVFALAARSIAAAFNRDAQVTDVATRCLHVAATFQFFEAISLVARGVLLGTGDVKYSAVVGVATSWLSTPPLAYLLGWRLGLGAAGGWVGLVLEAMVNSCLLTLRIKRRHWARPDPRAAGSPVRLDLPERLASS